jgi:23S rRNA (uracil1939-C5)-methyltransferase
MLKQALLLDVVATHLDVRGDGVVSHDGTALTVPGILPGEDVQVRVTHVSRRSARAWGVLKRFNTPHPERRAPSCAQQGRCGGCPLMIANSELQLQLKQQSLGHSLGFSVEPIVVGEHELGYRWSSKRVFGGSPGKVVLGSYVRGSHRVAPMHDCLVDHPDIAAYARYIERTASELDITPYQEETKEGDLRYVLLKTDGRGAVLVTLISASEDTRAAELASHLDAAAGVSWCVQGDAGNAMRGEGLRTLRGKKSISIELCGHTVEVGPLDFLQPNPAVAELAYRDLVGEERGAVAFDLYAGAGVTTALLRESFEEVIPCELERAAADKLGVEAQSVEDFLNDARERQQAPELVVANPPRAGLGEAVCAELNRMASGETRLLRIMSCHPKSLSRDVERLTGSDGGYRLQWARAYDTLPQTSHVELVVSLEAISK